MRPKQTLFLFAALLGSAASATLNKCCPTGHRVHHDLKTCVPSQNATSQFQNRTLAYVPVSDGQFNIPCPPVETDTLVWDSVDTNFTVDWDTLELVPHNVKGVDKFREHAFCLDRVDESLYSNAYWIAFTCPCIQRGVCLRACCLQGHILVEYELGK